MKATKKITMTKKEKDAIINGLNLLIEYGYAYKEIFGCSLTDDYAVCLPDDMLEGFKASLDSSYINIIKD